MKTIDNEDGREITPQDTNDAFVGKFFVIVRISTIILFILYAVFSKYDSLHCNFGSFEISHKNIKWQTSSLT